MADDKSTHIKLGSARKLPVSVCVCVCVECRPVAVQARMHSCSSVCVLLCVCCFLSDKYTSQLCREMPSGHESSHMAPLVRINHLSKSNCTVEKLNCAHMIMQEQRQSKALSLKDFEASQQSKYIFKEDRLFRAAGR